jgi:hypothetical protein
MMDFIKVALRDGSGNEALMQLEFVKQAQRYHGARAFQFVNDYFLERTKKQTFIDEQIFAQGYEKEDFLKVLAKAKGKDRPLY